MQKRAKYICKIKKTNKKKTTEKNNKCLGKTIQNKRDEQCRAKFMFKY